MDLPGVHGDLPDDPAELAVARALITASGGRWQLWFGLQRNNNEMDDLVLAPDIGCFAIEVKGWRIGSLREYTDDHVTTGSGRHRHPLKQAQQAMHGLKGYLDDRRIGRGLSPFLCSTAAFPNITRTEMYEACGDDWEQHFEGMLFAEEISDPSLIERRLGAIFKSPPLGIAGPRPPRSAQVEAVTQILDRRVVLQLRPPADGMAKVFQRIHDGPSRAGKPPTQDTPPTAEQRRELLQTPGASVRNGVSRVVFHGKAGTGKTTELLKIALAHALAGRLTLVCCYTKVLAAELRARMAMLPGFDEVAGNLLVVDLGQLGSSEDAIGFGGFQTICVDEAQDVAQQKFEDLRALAAPDAEWFLADAPGQAIFDQRSTFTDDAVVTAKANGTWESKRISRRTGIAEVLVCDAALQIAPDVALVPGWVADHPIRTTRLSPDEEQEELGLDIHTEVLGQLPVLHRLPADTGWNARVSGYRDLIRAELGWAERRRAPVDLAIVAVRRGDMLGEWKKVKAALAEFGLGYLDQVDHSNKRRSPAPGEVRLVTLHSMRGVDADRVILLDIEGLEAIPNEAARPALLNIALSRARHGTTVVLRPMDSVPGTYRHFVEELVGAYRPADEGR